MHDICTPKALANQAVAFCAIFSSDAQRQRVAGRRDYNSSASRDEVKSNKHSLLVCLFAARFGVRFATEDRAWGGAPQKSRALGRSRTDRISEVLDRLEAQQQRDGDGSPELELASGEASLDFLQKVYRSSRQPLAVRMRAAAIALPFESPKPTAMAVGSMNGEHFAAMLERAIARTAAPPRQIEHRPDETAPGVSWTGPLRGSTE